MFNVYSLKGGIQHWRASGLCTPTRVNSLGFEEVLPDGTFRPLTFVAGSSFKGQKSAQ